LTALGLLRAYLGRYVAFGIAVVIWALCITAAISGVGLFVAVGNG
jgi:hypothetical protein